MHMADQSSPENSPHERIVQIIADLYAGNDRLLAVFALGSVGRGTADAYSDVDLAAIVRDDVQIDLPGELDRMMAALARHGHRLLFQDIAGDDIYVLLHSLIGVNIGFHKLAATSPYVLAGCRVLVGSLDAATIQAAAKANEEPQPPLSQLVHQALWLAVIVDIALQRGQFWAGLPSLERARIILFDIFARSRGVQRAARFFEQAAGADLRAKFGRTLPTFFPESPARSSAALAGALLALLDLIEYDLEPLSNGQMHLGPDERESIALVRARQARLHDSAAAFGPDARANA
jgi:hypothetical protein